MFKLILILILFILFTINYFFGYMTTMPYFQFITKFNFYEYILDKFDDRNGSFSGMEYKVASSSGNYILDYSWWVLQTDLKYLSKKSDKLAIFMPILILHTWEKLIFSWDNLFTWLELQKDFQGYSQYITWWNDYIDIWWEIINKKYRKQTLYLGYLYTYCSMSQTWWIDAYYYDRYIEWNKNRDDNNETLVAGSYVCENDKTSISNDGWTVLTYCSCNNKWNYWICKNWADWICNINNCIDYWTWTINLNNTNCSLSWALWQDIDKSKYFFIR